MVGSVYAANTLGAIVGSLGASLLLTVWLGSQHAQQLLILVAALSGDAADRGAKRRRRHCMAVAVAAAALLAFTVPPVPGLLVAFGRYSATQDGDSTDHLCGRRVECVGGRLGAIERRAQLPQRRQGSGLQRAAGHAAAADARSSDDARARQSAVGPGHRLRRRRDGGRGLHRSAGRARDHRRDRAARAAGRLHVFRRAQLRRRAQSEGRRCASTMPGISCSRPNRSSTPITSDPLDPWVKGAAMLYTTEFFELVKRHLNPGGVVTLFVQLYESNTRR